MNIPVNPFEMTSEDLNNIKGNQASEESDPPWLATDAQNDPRAIIAAAKELAAKEEEAAKELAAKELEAEEEAAEEEAAKVDIIDEPNPVVLENNQMAEDNQISQSKEDPINVSPIVDDVPVGTATFQRGQFQPQPPQQPMQQPSQPIQPQQMQQPQPQPQQMQPQPQPQQMQQPMQPPRNTNGFDNYSNDTEVMKYKIFDLYWLTQGGVNGVCALSIGYNIDFDNLRFSYHMATGQNTFTANSMELNSMTKMCTFNVFSEIAEQLLQVWEQPTWKIKNFERVFKRSDSWSPADAGFIKDQYGIKILANCNGSMHEFVLTQQWQITAMKKALEFSVRDARLLKISKFQK